MKNNPKGRIPEVGDWVRFYQGGKLVIGVVGYIREQKYYPYGEQLQTEIGTVDVPDVVEARGNG